MDALSLALDPHAKIVVMARWRRIVLDVAAETGVTFEQLMGKDRRKPLHRARVECYRRMIAAGMSYSAIGRAMRRNHTTVMSALGLFDERRKLKRFVPPEHEPRPYDLDDGQPEEWQEWRDYDADC